MEQKEYEREFNGKMTKRKEEGGKEAKGRRVERKIIHSERED